MAKADFQNLRVYRLAEELSDVLWNVVLTWDSFSRDIVGKQLARAADSIGANIAEGAGRGSFLDNRRFVKIARGSLNETIHFLRRAYRRKLVTQSQIAQIRPYIDELGPKLNSCLKSIGPVSVSKRKAVVSTSATDNGPLTTDSLNGQN